MTSLELDRKFLTDDPTLTQAQSAVFVQCVGSREPDRPYCSRVCAAPHSIDSALEMKKRNPDMNVYILFRDIRTYGEREYLYREAREKGVIFIRYDLENKPQVNATKEGLEITVIDHVLQQTDHHSDRSADPGHRHRAQQGRSPGPSISRYRSTMTASLWKNMPSSARRSSLPTASSSAGLAHYPKPIDEAITQGKAAASRAVTLLARKTISTSGQVAAVDPMMCSNCGVCVSICPYSAPSFIPADARMNPGKAQINPVLCKGCGLCVASCRSGRHPPERV